MRKIVSFSIAFAILTTTILGFKTMHVNALLCANGNTVADAPAGATPEEKLQYESSACIGNGGTRFIRDGCKEGSFFGLPVWYKYLDKQTIGDELTGAEVCEFKINGIAEIWLVVAAVIEILLRISSMLAIGFIIFGGVSYVISEGSPDKTKKAQSTVISAVVGLVISVVAAAVVSFIAGRF